MSIEERRLRIWAKVNLAFLSIATSLTFWAILMPHLVVCEENLLFYRYCNLTLNVFDIKETTRAVVQLALQETNLLVVGVRVILCIHCICSVIGWLSYVFCELPVLSTVSTAIGHLFGWSLLGVIVQNRQYALTLIQLLFALPVTTTMQLQLGSGLIASFVATGMQLLTVLSTLLFLRSSSSPSSSSICCDSDYNPLHAM